MKQSPTYSADQIKQLVTAYWTRKRWAVHSEVGLCRRGRLRADLVAISMGSYIVVVEVKSSVADFKADKKVLNYVPYCDKLYFAMSQDVYIKVSHLVPSGVGVFVVSDRLKVRVKKRAVQHPVADKVRLNIMTRMAYRSADFTKWERKNKTAGAKFMANLVVKTLRTVKKPRTEKQVVQALATALNPYV